MRISDWSSDVCSSDLPARNRRTDLRIAQVDGCRVHCGTLGGYVRLGLFGRGLRIVGFLAAYRIDLGEIGVTLGLQTRSLDGGFGSGILTQCGLQRSAVGRIIDLVQQTSLLHIERKSVV